MTLKVFLAFLLSISIVIAALGQQPTPTPPTSKPETGQKPTTSDVDAQDVVKITTNLVQIDAVVTKDNKAVTDLQPSDFEIFEDNQPQAITNFSYISNLPNVAATAPPAKNGKDQTGPPVLPAKINPNDQRRIVALVVDDLGISFEGISPLRNQIRKFLDTLAPNDLVAIIRTGGDVGALQQFTNDRRVLDSAVDHLRWNPCSRAGLHVFAPVGSLGPNTGLCSQYVINSTFKSLRFLIKGMRELPGRKSLVFFSDYLPIQDQQPSAYEETQISQSDAAAPATNSDDSNIPDPGIGYSGQLQRIAELAIRASVVIYSVDTRGLQYTGPTAADRISFPSRASVSANQVLNDIMGARSRQLTMGREGSELIARQTGGFLVRNSNDFGLKRVMQDQEGYYLIGFRPAEETFNRDFHHIKVKVKRNGLTVRTRAGFYGFTDEQTKMRNLSAKDQMAQALISPFVAKDITLKLTSFFIEDQSQGTVVRSFLYLDQHDLNFTETDGWHITNLDIQSIMFGDNGRVLGQEDRSGRLKLRGEAYQRALRDGVVYSFDIPVRARGAFQFRVAVRDQDTGRIGSAGQFMEVPNLQSGRLALSGIVAREENSTRGSGAETYDDVNTGPALRRFHQGAVAIFAYAIYNGSLNGQAPQLTSQIRLFREGKLIFTGNPAPVNVAGQADLKRLTNLARLQLGTDMVPGDYVFQMIVTDASDKQKSRVASQWIDFEVVK
jgi:VWFA-related protein